MEITNLIDFKAKALQWAAAFEVCCCFDSNTYPDQYSRYDFLLAAGKKRELAVNAGTAFDALKSFRKEKKSWLFGLLGYDLKNETEQLASAHTDLLGFSDLYFFEPEYLLAIKNGQVEILVGPESLLLLIEATLLPLIPAITPVMEIKSRMDKETYLGKVEELREHILRGDIYEVNFCQEFYAEAAQLDPLALYYRLNSVSPTPFSAYFKAGTKYILSASPERYLCKRGSKIFSQPIKGTAKRSSDQKKDEALKAALRNDLKEQAENVMIVDLVRNDLTRCAVPGSVQVEELFGIYSFPQVHQMISTVSCQLDPSSDLIDAIRHTFPMGSMTGAPKIRAMQLIEEMELSKRGAYSGAIGYLDPDDDFDFNVLIRSIFYAADKQYLSFQVGGAITYASSAAAEYEECILKASAMVDTLQPEQLKD
ncbi:anthranilate synthase component I family protein [Pedobacter antarcticus]|uniref:anthranilate synthase component I family protein n=1 Tax=Pedobacter antarcticus TaxID=34086 RepID=UPI001C584350|nr:anthranilate synthase component I family protein [Pedobacter antarcticus]